MVDNHIIVHPSNYRGRSISVANVQDYLSNIVSKHLPRVLPPWQICVIPIFGPAPTSTPTSTSNLVSLSSPRSSDQAGTSSQSNDHDTETEQQLFNDSLSVS